MVWLFTKTFLKAYLDRYRNIKILAVTTGGIKFLFICCNLRIIIFKYAYNYEKGDEFFLPGKKFV